MMFFLSFFFSAPDLGGRSVDCRQILTCSRVSWIYKIGSEILGPLTQKFGSSKTSAFGSNFGQIHNLMANISGTKQDIT